MTADPAMILGLGLLSTACIALAARHPRQKKKNAALAFAMCPCEHEINYHEKLTGRCHAKRLAVTHYNGQGTARSWQEVDCDCQVYAGPELIRGLTGLPILPPPDFKADP